MAKRYQDWENLGRNVQDIVDHAIVSRDYEQLNQTIRQVVAKAVDIGNEVVRSAVSGANGGNQTPVVQQKNLPALYGSTSNKTTKGVLMVVGGGIAAAASGLSLLARIAMDLMIYGDVWLTGGMLFELLLLGAGAVLLYGGVRILGKVKRFKTYRKTLGQKTHITLEKLARSVGKSVKFVRRELYKMIDEGLFLEGHLDHEQRHLITSDETYQHYEQSRLLLEQRQQEAAVAKEAAEKARKTVSGNAPQVQEVLDKGNAFIAEIRRCNDAIPGEDISAKIYHMEMIVQRIFQRAETNPEIIPDLKKMMDYYLPMTVKLLNAYADMDAQPVQGENIVGAKREIEATLDTLNLAFEKLLDSVFADTAMDISSDISVLNTMLAQEGLTEDALSQMKKQQNV